jgi:hypothetical protein
MHSQRQPTEHSYRSRQPSRQPRQTITRQTEHVDYGSMIRSQSRESVITARSYLKTPNEWGLARLATPIEVRGQLTTLERYHLNRTKSSLSTDFQPYSHRDYLNQKHRDQTMKLPRGLGPTDDERWKKEVFTFD